jgi:hypothetical protein
MAPQISASEAANLLRAKGTPRLAIFANAELLPSGELTA